MPEEDEVDEITDEEIVAWVAGHYNRNMAESVLAALRDTRSPMFAKHVRRSFVREMRDQAKQERPREE